MVKVIRLSDLASKAHAVSPGGAGFYEESCMMCFDIAGHASGVEISVDFAGIEEKVGVKWTGTVTPRMRLGYADRKKTLDFGACTIALLLVPEFTKFTAFEQSPTGDRIDYYLTNDEVDDELIFNNTALLEISGIQVYRKKIRRTQLRSAFRRNGRAIRRNRQQQQRIPPTYQYMFVSSSLAVPRRRR